jgi:outer membrane protein assembly factor BamA
MRSRRYVPYLLALFSHLLVFLCLTAQDRPARRPIVQVTTSQNEMVKQLEEKASLDSINKKTPLYTVRDISLNGNRITKPYIILREVILEKGNAYSLKEIIDKINTSRINLLNTQLFTEVQLGHTNWNSDSLDIIVDVKERWYYFPVPIFRIVDRNFNVWIKDHGASLSRVDWGVKFDGNNFTGRNDKVSLSLIGGYTQQIGFNYILPYIDKKLKQGIFFDFSYSRNREVQYNTVQNKQAFYKDESRFIRDQFRMGIGYTYRKASISRHVVRFNYVNDRVADTIASLNPNFYGNGKSQIQFGEFFYGFEYFKLDYIPYPLKGLRYDISFTQRGFRKEMHLSQLVGRVNYYFPVMPKTYMSLGLVASAKLPFDQPYYNQRLLGFGQAYLRGLEYYVLDGVVGALSRTTLSRELVSFKVRTFLKSRSYEYIPFRIYAKVYGDFGYAYAKEIQSNKNFLNNRFLYTGGLGIDMLTVHDILLRLEFSFNQLGENGLFLHSR